MNVFEHLSFLLRRPPDAEHPLGERVRRTYREIMTGPDEELYFDYPLEYLNVAALGLCAALTQAALEPETAHDLEARIAAPLSLQEFEQAVTPFRCGCLPASPNRKYCLILWPSLPALLAALCWRMCFIVAFLLNLRLRIIWCAVASKVCN